MAKLTRDRNTKRRDGVYYGLPAGEEIFAGALVAVNSDGEAVSATADGKNVLGVAQHAARTGHLLHVRRGVFAFIDDKADITRADIGATAYVVDDQTVGKAGTAGTTAEAGVIFDVDSDGVWVKI